MLVLPIPKRTDEDRSPVREGGEVHRHLLFLRPGMWFTARGSLKRWSGRAIKSCPGWAPVRTLRPSPHVLFCARASAPVAVEAPADEDTPPFLDHHEVAAELAGTRHGPRIRHRRATPEGGGRLYVCGVGIRSRVTERTVGFL